MAWTDKMQDVSEAANAAEFASILASDVHSRWFEILIRSAGTFLFTGALILNALKFYYACRDYSKATNKNLNQKGALAISAIQFGLIATAILGGVCMPILMFASIAVDTVKNILLTGWNVFKLAQLTIKVRTGWSISQLLRLNFRIKNGLDDPLTQIKYEKLRKKYVEKIKEYGIGAAIGMVISAAVALVLAAPQLGLTGVAAITIGWGVIKTTLAGVFGVLSSVTMLGSFFAMRMQIKAKMKSKEEKNAKNEKRLRGEHVDDNVEQLAKNVPSVNAGQNAESIYIYPPKIKEVINHKLNFTAWSKHSLFREVIIRNIDKDAQKSAMQVLYTMVTDKIENLKDQIIKAENSSISFLRSLQKNTRQQKIDALRLIQKFLLKETITDAQGSLIQNIAGLIAHIKATYPAVYDSFFLDKSDTSNVIKATKAFGLRFDAKQKNLSVLAVGESLDLYHDVRKYEKKTLLFK